MITVLENERLKEKQEEIKAQLCTSIYGEMPPKSIHLSGEIDYSDPSFAAGKATKSGYKLMLDLGDRELSLPITSIIPSGGGKHPAIIIFTTEKQIPNKYLPAEELVDRGYAIFSLSMSDVSGNDGKFKSGISGYIARSRRKKSSPGKLAVWAWAILRVAEYVCDLEYIDQNAIAVAGHGICARAAMLAAGFDKRIGFIIANGVASSPIPFSKQRPKSGLTVHDYPHLYCPAFAEEPFGDEYAALLSLCAPRCILIGSASDTFGLDKDEEYSYLSSLSEEYYLPRGLSGIGAKKNIPTASMQLRGGEISYHVRHGVDYFSREDWNVYLDFIDEKIGEIR